MMNFWLDKGIGGFRMDVIDLIGKDPDNMITGNGPNLHQLIQEMNRNTFGHYDVMTVGETWGVTPETAPLYASPERNELSMVFQFEHLTLDEEPNTSKWDLMDLDFINLKRVFKKWQTELPKDTWNSLFWNNHDTPRIVSRWGNDKEYRENSAKCFATILHMMRGTPYIFQGEEIGMTNRPISDISEAEDIESVNIYHERLSKGYTHDEVIQSINAKGRDNARRPMQWTSEEQAGFTTGKPWLSVNENYLNINVAENLADDQSVFATYKKLIELRKENDIVVKGEFKLLLEEHPQVFAFGRYYNGEKWTVVANFTDKPCDVSIGDQTIESKGILISSHNRKRVNLAELELEPYESFVIKN